jgi:hypothetical protein
VKLVQLLVLTVLATTATAAIAPPATATTLTSPGGTIYTGTVDTQGKVGWDGPFAPIECAQTTLSTLVETHGSSTTAKLPIAFFTAGQCNLSFVLLKKGFLELHTDSASADGNATVTWSGFEIKFNTSIGECTFAANPADAGTLTGSDTANATWSIGSATLTKTAGSILCGTLATMTGSFTITSPSTLTVD